MIQSGRRSRTAWLAVALALSLAACSSSTVTPSPPVATSPAVTPGTVSTSTVSSPPAALASAAPSSSTDGFAFAADDVIGYYESLGFACTPTRPSTKAAGFSVRSCEMLDDAGRARVVGIVTDPDGDLANGFASVLGKEGETFLAPTDALEPLAGFLGAMLGEDRGATVLPWLAGHLGDAYAETDVGAIRVATYAESEDDPSKLYVELANQAYLDAPAP